MIADISQLNDNVLQLQINSTPSVLLQCVAQAQTQIGWEPTGDVDSDELVLLPAGHVPGVYHVIAPLIIRTAAAAGILERIISFSAPTVGALLTPGADPDPSSVSIATIVAMDDSSIISDGTAPITVKYHPSGVVDPCVIDFYAAVLMAGRL